MLKVSDTVFKNQLESRIPCYLLKPLVSKRYKFTVFFILNLSERILKCQVKCDCCSQGLFLAYY